MKMSAALVALAVLAGCGGGDKTMSATQWSKRVEAICVKREAAAFKAGEKLGRRSANASKQELAYKTLQLESRLLGPWVDEIDALPRPQGQEQDAGKFIADMRALADLLGRTATAIKQNDAATGKALVKRITAKTASARSEARSLDIEKCNTSPQGAGSSS